MKDFHLTSLHQTISPLILVVQRSRNTSYLLVKTRAGQTQQAIADLEQLSKEFNPNYPFSYHFMDEEYEKMYRSEQQVNTLVNYFGMLAILISCLGLFALAAFTAEQRTKEIGVRKVLGASIGNIIGLLSTDFLKLVFIALVLASPLAWWAVSEWLGTFAYQAKLAWWIFGTSGSAVHYNCIPDRKLSKHQSGHGESGKIVAIGMMYLRTHGIHPVFSLCMYMYKTRTEVRGYVLQKAIQIKIQYLRK